MNEFAAYVDNKLVREGLEKISSKFASPDHSGPKQVTDFEGTADEEEIALIRRGAFEKVDYLLRSLGIKKWVPLLDSNVIKL